MSADPKTVASVFADAHARIDDQDKKLDSLAKSLTPEAIAALMHGIMASAQVQWRDELKQLLRTQREDVESDRKVAQTNEDIAACLKEQNAKLEALTTAMTKLTQALEAPREFEVIRGADGKITGIH